MSLCERREIGTLLTSHSRSGGAAREVTAVVTASQPAPTDQEFSKGDCVFWVAEEKADLGGSRGGLRRGRSVVLILLVDDGSVLCLDTHRATICGTDAPDEDPGVIKAGGCFEWRLPHWRMVD